MRNLLLIVLACASLPTAAQWDLLTTPVTQDRFVVQFTNDMWLDAPDSVEFRNVSLGFSAYIMHDYAFGESALSFAWGYGFSSHNIHSNGEFRTDTLEGTAQSIFRPFPENYSYRKNKLSVNYLEIPIELRLRTGKRKERKTWDYQAEKESVGPQFNMAIGARIGYSINVHTKTIDDAGKRKFYGVDYLQPLRYGLTARIGFGSIALTGFYSLTPLIKEGRGTQVIPVSVGVAWLVL